MIYERLNGESDEELIYRICGLKDEIGTWSDVADVINELTGNDYGESTYRKKYQAFCRMFESNRNKLQDTSKYVENIDDKIRELERTKIKMRDERRAWNKQNYSDARWQEFTEIFGEQFEDVGSKIFPKTVTPVIDSDNDLFIMLSDMHIGQSFDSYFGKYNVDIAFERLQKYVSEIFTIQKRHNAKIAYVSIQGDLISGVIHKTLMISNDTDSISQIEIASEYISWFLHQLSQKFEEVVVANVVGNHSRVNFGEKSDTPHNERLDSLIYWIVEKLISDVDNVTFLPNNIDSGISKMIIRNRTFINVHGDYDTFDKMGVGKFVTMFGEIPYAMTFGHMHINEVSNINGIKIIRGGNFAGTGCDYTIEKRLSGEPEQIVCVVNENKGIECYYSVSLV